MSETRVFYISVVFVILSVSFLFYDMYQKNMKFHPCSMFVSNEEVIEMFKTEIERSDDTIEYRSTSKTLERYSYCGDIRTMYFVQNKKGSYLFISVDCRKENNEYIVDELLKILINNQVINDDEEVYVSFEKIDTSIDYKFTIEQYKAYGISEILRFSY